MDCVQSLPHVSYLTLLIMLLQWCFQKQEYCRNVYHRCFSVSLTEIKSTGEKTKLTVGTMENGTNLETSYTLCVIWCISNLQIWKFKNENYIESFHNFYDTN